MAYFFQTRLQQKTVAARYTNYPLISIPSRKKKFDSGKLTTQDGHLHSAGMAYFFQTRLKQKKIAASFTNQPVFCIPSQNCFLIQAG